MAITSIGAYGLSPGSTSVTISPPAGSASGDRAIIWIANKLSTVTPTTPANFTLIGSVVVGTGTNGAGNGPIRITAWYRDLTAAAGSTTITITSGNVSNGGGQIYRKGAGETWATPTMQVGTDTTSGTPFAAAMPGQDSYGVGDWAYSIAAATTNAVNPSARVISIPGCTLTVTGINSGGTTIGNDIFVWTDHANVTAGSQNAAGSTTATLAVASTGGAAQVRVALAANTATGTISGTLAPATGALTGTARDAGAIAGTLTNVVSALTGAAKTAGAMSAALQPLSGGLTGYIADRVTLAGSLQPVTAGIVGTLSAQGTVGGTLAKATSTLTGTARDTATLGGTLQPAAGALAGTAVDRATLLGVLQSLTASLTGNVEVPFVEGTLNGTLAGVQAALAGEATSTGEILGTIAAIEASLAAGALASGQLFGVLSAPIATFTGNLDTPMPPRDILFVIEVGPPHVSIQTGPPRATIEVGTTARTIVETAPSHTTIIVGAPRTNVEVGDMDKKWRNGSKQFIDFFVTLTDPLGDMTQADVEGFPFKIFVAPGTATPAADDPGWVDPSVTKVVNAVPDTVATFKVDILHLYEVQQKGIHGVFVKFGPTPEEPIYLVTSFVSQ